MMSKREASTATDDDEQTKRQSKRRKVASGANDAPVASRPERITSAKQLQTLLAFQQGAVPELISGIRSFKLFLDSILYPPEDADVKSCKSILREYLELQRFRTASDAQPTISLDLFQTWSFADSIHHDHLFSSATAVLALLLKTLSKDSEFQEYGELFCKSLLQHTHSKLLSHGLSAFKHKTHVISPSLRLLTELVSYDGGSFARQLYLRRDHTFDPKILSRNLGLSWSASGGSESSLKPSVRSNAVRYLLASLKYQYEGAKLDILKQGGVLRALFNRIHEDPPGIAVEILDVIRENVLLDGSLPRSSKSYLMTDRNLTSIASLYRVHRGSEEADGSVRKVEDVAHEFLTFVCTTPDLGVMYQSSGWYPRGTDKDAPIDQVDGEKQQEVPAMEPTYRTGIPLRNMKLASFIQTLKPYSNIKEQELILSIFKACPELVADYFPKKANFSFDPKLTATWVGYSSFLFSTILLPIPRFFGRRESFPSSPPPTSVVIENILPQPLTQKVLTRCLNQSSNLITFFGTRILVIALHKLKQVLSMFQAASEKSPSKWEVASRALMTEFSHRCPKMKDVMTVFWKTSPESVLQREAITRLLAMYYQTIPSLAVDEKFDISKPLATALAKSLEITENHDDLDMSTLVLEHLVEIASYSPSMRWWQKPDSLHLSPFSTLLMIVSSSSADNVESLAKIRDLLTKIVMNHGILQSSTQITALDGLIASLSHLSEQHEVLQYLDNCIGRFVQKPIKYLDDYDMIKEQIETSKQDRISAKPLSMVLLAIMEQWPFLVKASENALRLKIVSEWLARLLALLKDIGEDDRMLNHVFNEVYANSNNDIRHILTDEFNSPDREALENLLRKSMNEDKVRNGVSTEERISSQHHDSMIDLDAPPTEDEDHRGLHKWAQKEPDEAIEEGAAGELLLCLCSVHVGIRREALTNLQKLAIKLKDTNYPEKDQACLLLNEVVETARDRIGEMPLPYVAGVFAAHAMAVLSDPTHFMYTKVNQYLNKGPSWRVGKLPSHWVANALLAEPSDLDAYYKEVEWVMDLFFDSLRTQEDLNIYRARGIFERILALYGSRYLSSKTKVKILRVISRATFIDGGSTTLITRAGILGWIQGKQATQDGNNERLKELEERLYKTCDMSRVEEWSHGALCRR